MFRWGFRHSREQKTVGGGGNDVTQEWQVCVQSANLAPVMMYVGLRFCHALSMMLTHEVLTQAGKERLMWVKRSCEGLVGFYRPMRF